MTNLADRVEASAGDGWFTATVSQDATTIGIDHPADADWFEVRRAHVALRDRLNERLDDQDKCPVRPARATEEEQRRG